MKKFKQKKITKRVDRASFILSMTMILSMAITSTMAIITRDPSVYVSANDYQQDVRTLTAGVSRQIELELYNCINNSNVSANDYQQDIKTLTAGVSRQIELELYNYITSKSFEIESNDATPVTASSMLDNNEEIIKNQVEIESSPSNNEYVDVEYESEVDSAYYENYGEYITTTTRLDEKFVPDGYGKVHTYMAWQCITSKSSLQYKLRIAAQNFDEEGFGKIGDRYAVAMKPYYGEIGDYLDITQTDGSVYKVVIADHKGNENGNSGTSSYIHYDSSLVEFVVDKGMWYSTSYGGWNSTMHENPGTKDFHPELGLNITKIENVGNYWDYDHELMNQ